MRVTKIELGPNKKYLISIEDQFALFLYYRELVQLEITEESELTPEELARIKVEIEYPRAKKKAMDLLIRMDMCEQDVRSKLTRHAFSPDAIDQAIAYLYQYHYLDDHRYAAHFIESKKRTKSKRAIAYELQQKGVHASIIEDLLSDYQEEEKVIRRLILKKSSHPGELSYEEQNKIIASICRKGFSFEKVRQCMRDIESQV